MDDNQIRVHIPPIHVPTPTSMNVRLLCSGFLFGIILGIFLALVTLAILTDFGIYPVFCNRS